MRAVISGALGLALFVLGVAYLSLGRQPDVATFFVLGGTHVRAGAPAAVRVRARLADARSGVPVVVAPVHPGADGVQVDGEEPAIVSFRVPADARGAYSLALSAQVGPRQQELVVELPVVRGSSRVGLPDLEPGLSETTLAHRVQVLPEAGELAANMDNRVFVRVLDVEHGAPVAGAAVTVEHPALTGGEHACTTDASGLCELSLVARQPSFRLVVEVRQGEVATRTDALLRPRGRRMLLRSPSPVVPPGEPVRVELTTWEAEETVYCDLLESGAWIASRRVGTRRGAATIDLGPLAPGRYDLQCYAHDIDPGDAFATLPVIVEAGDPLEVALRVARGEGLVHRAAAVAPPGTVRALALRYWTAVLRADPRPPRVLVSTREADLAARTELHEAAKQRLLLAIGAIVLVVLLWVAETILKNILTTRDSLRRVATEMLHDGDLVDVDDLTAASFSSRSALVKTRGVLLLVVVGGAIVCNVVGLVLLFLLIR